MSGLVRACDKRAFHVSWGEGKVVYALSIRVNKMDVSFLRLYGTDLDSRRGRGHTARESREAARASETREGERLERSLT